MRGNPGRLPHGFSLVELLVAVAVLGVATTVAMLAIGSALRAGGMLAQDALYLNAGEEVLVQQLLKRELDWPPVSADGVWECLTEEEQRKLRIVAVKGPRKAVSYEQWLFVAEEVE